MYTLCIAMSESLESLTASHVHSLRTKTYLPGLLQCSLWRSSDFQAHLVPLRGGDKVLTEVGPFSTAHTVAFSSQIVFGFHQQPVSFCNPFLSFTPLAVVLTLLMPLMEESATLWVKSLAAQLLDDNLVKFFFFFRNYDSCLWLFLTINYESILCMAVMPEVSMKL